MRRISVQWILILTAVATSALELPAQVDDTVAISATWLHRIPNLDIWRSRADNVVTTGNWLIADTLRNRFIYFGGGDQCLWTTRPDSAWIPMYDTGWDVTPVSRFVTDVHGDYFITGMTTHWYYRTTMSTDGGETWKIFEPDSSLMRFVGVTWDSFNRNEDFVTNVGGFPAWDYSQRHGAIIYSRDRGVTFDTIFFPKIYTEGPGNGFKSHPRTTPQLYHSAWFGPDSVWREYDLRTKENWVHTGWPMMWDWRRLRDGTIVGVNGHRVVTRPPNGSWKTQTIDEIAQASYLYNPAMDLQTIGDSAVIILFRYGQLVRVNAGQQQPVCVVSPSIHTTREHVQDFGRYRTMYSYTVNMTSNALDSTSLYVTYDLAQNRLHHFTTHGTHSSYDQFFGNAIHYPGSGLLTRGDGTSLRLHPRIQGEVVFSKDSMHTWSHVQKVDRTARVPYEYLDVKNVRCTHDGRILARVVDHRIILEPKERDSVWPILLWEGSPFSFPPSHPNRQFDGGHVSYGLPDVYLDEQDNIVACGNVIVRWTLDGKQVDTLLDERATFFTVTEFSELYAAGGDTLWLSFNKGEEWQAVNLEIPISPDLQRAAVSSFLELPNGDLLLGLRGLWKQVGIEEYKDSCYGGIWRSTDKGDTWAHTSSSFTTDTYIIGMFRNPQTSTLYAVASRIVDEGRYHNGLRRKGDRDLYVQTSWRIYRSTDDGYNWEPTFSWGGLGNAVTTSLAYTFGKNGELHLAVPRMQYLRSHDDGKTWIVPHTLGLDTAMITSMVTTPDGRLVFGTTKGIAAIDLVTSSVSPELTTPYELQIQNADDDLIINLPFEDTWRVTASDMSGRMLGTTSGHQTTSLRLSGVHGHRGAVAVQVTGTRVSIGTVVIQ